MNAPYRIGYLVCRALVSTANGATSAGKFVASCADDVKAGYAEGKKPAKKKRAKR